MVWLGAEETNELKYLARLLHPGEVFVDCGANIGIWSITAARFVGDSGFVHAFEPNPATYQKLKANVELSGSAQTVSYYQKAVGNCAGTLPFLCEEKHNLSHIASDPAAPNIVRAAVTTLDEEFSTRHVHGVKVDVEGYEFAVLKGAEKLLCRCRPWLCLEFNSAVLGDPRISRWAVHQLLERLNYVPHLLPSMLAADPIRISTDWTSDGYVNILYLPSGR